MPTATLRLALISLFVAAFVLLRPPSRFIKDDDSTMLLLSGSIVVLSLVQHRTPLVAFALYLVAPALKTLTSSTSNNTISPLAGMLFAIHLMARSEALGLTAALAASVVLASRLQSNADVYCLLLLATIVFGTLPPLLASVPAAPLALMPVTVGVVYTVCGPKEAAIAAAGLAASEWGAKGLRKYLSRWKVDSRGPWDYQRPEQS